MQQREDGRRGPARLGLGAVGVGGRLRAEVVAVGGEVEDREEGHGYEAAEEDGPGKPFVGVRAREAVAELGDVHLLLSGLGDEIVACTERERGFISWLENAAGQWHRGRKRVDIERGGRQ